MAKRETIIRCIIGILAFFLLFSSLTSACERWWDSDWEYRIPAYVVIPDNASSLYVTAEINFTKLLGKNRVAEPVDTRSIAVVVGCGDCMVVPSIFLPDEDFRLISNAVGRVLWKVDTHHLEVGVPKLYYIYFNTLGKGKENPLPLTLTALNLNFRGYRSYGYKIPTLTYRKLQESEGYRVIELTFNASQTPEGNSTAQAEGIPLELFDMVSIEGFWAWPTINQSLKYKEYLANGGKIFWFGHDCLRPPTESILKTTYDSDFYSGSACEPEVHLRPVGPYLNQYTHPILKNLPSNLTRYYCDLDAASWFSQARVLLAVRGDDNKTHPVMTAFQDSNSLGRVVGFYTNLYVELNRAKHVKERGSQKREKYALLELTSNVIRWLRDGSNPPEARLGEVERGHVIRGRPKTRWCGDLFIIVDDDIPYHPPKSPRFGGIHRVKFFLGGEEVYSITHDFSRSDLNLNKLHLNCRKLRGEGALHLLWKQLVFLFILFILVFLLFSWEMEAKLERERKKKDYLSL